LCNKELISNKRSIIFWQEIKDSLPAPDIRPLEDRLNYLKKNIFKSLPNSRLTSKTDSPAYSRAATHVLAFKVQNFVHLPLLLHLKIYHVWSTIQCGKVLLMSPSSSMADLGTKSLIYFPHTILLHKLTFSPFFFTSFLDQ